MPTRRLTVADLLPGEAIVFGTSKRDPVTGTLRPFVPRPAFIMLSGWGGKHETAVLVIGETPKRWRIRSATGRRMKVAGRDRWIEGEETCLVPKRAVRFADSPPADAQEVPGE
jgi:hypothetical protein